MEEIFNYYNFSIKKSLYNYERTYLQAECLLAFKFIVLTCHVPLTKESTQRKNFRSLGEKRLILQTQI